MAITLTDLFKLVKMVKFTFSAFTFFLRLYKCKNETKPRVSCNLHFFKQSDSIQNNMRFMLTKMCKY